jgi:hypothetical protein
MTVLLMLLIVATPPEIYLPAAGLAVALAALSCGWAGSLGLPVIGRLAGQLRHHLEKVTIDWLSVAAIPVVALLWVFLRPRPDWLTVLPVAATAFACWTAQFAALPPGAMGRWLQFQLRSWRGGSGTVAAAPAEMPVPAAAVPPPAPVSPVDRTSWHADQQDRFDDWLAEEINRFEQQDAAPVKAAAPDDDRTRTQQS